MRDARRRAGRRHPARAGAPRHCRGGDRRQLAGAEQPARGAQQRAQRGGALGPSSQLQRALLGRAVLGYEDLFVAALLGALVAATPGLARRAAALALAGALALDPLFLVVDQLPATVPIAVRSWPCSAGPPATGERLEVSPAEGIDRGEVP